MTRVGLPILIARFYVVMIVLFIFLPIGMLVTFSFQDG